jgi:hypothetical protein
MSCIAQQLTPQGVFSGEFNPRARRRRLPGAHEDDILPYNSPDICPLLLLDWREI